MTKNRHPKIVMRQFRTKEILPLDPGGYIDNAPKRIHVDGFEFLRRADIAVLLPIGVFQVTQSWDRYPKGTLSKDVYAAKPKQP